MTRYFRRLDDEQDKLVRYALLVGLSKAIRRHLLHADINATKLFRCLDTARLKTMVKTYAVLYLLTLLRSYDNLYVYYKVAKYIYYLNYRYKPERMTNVQARQNIDRVVRNRTWSAVTEPLFVHSMLTLETKCTSDSLYHVFHLKVVTWFTLWTIGQLTGGKTWMTTLIYLISFQRNVSALISCAFVLLQPSFRPWLVGIILTASPIIFNVEIFGAVVNYLCVHRHFDDYVYVARQVVTDDYRDGYVVLTI